MRALNYIEIRTLVRSRSIDIDINKNVFNHPLYSKLQINNIDHNIKERAFNNSFIKVSDYSYDSNYSDALRELSVIKSHVILRPKKSYESIRNKTGISLYLTKFLNFFRNISHVRVKPYQIVNVPLMVNIIEGSTLPELSFNLSEEFIEKGLKVINTNASSREFDDTTVSIYNSSSKSISIKDLSYIGDIRIIVR